MPISPQTQNVLKTRLGDKRASQELVEYIHHASDLSLVLHTYCKELHKTVVALIDACHEAGVDVEKPAPPPDVITERMSDSAPPPPGTQPAEGPPPDQPAPTEPQAPYQQAKPEPPPATEQPQTEGGEHAPGEG